MTWCEYVVIFIATFCLVILLVWLLCVKLNKRDKKAEMTEEEKKVKQDWEDQQKGY